MTWETRTGTCAWCEKHNTKLYFIVWCFQGEMYTDWVCERCRRANMRITVNENED